MKHDRAIHITDSEPDDGPFCTVCRYGNIGLSYYRHEWWCEDCINREEWFEHCEEAGR